MCDVVLMNRILSESIEPVLVRALDTSRCRCVCPVIAATTAWIKTVAKLSKCVMVLAIPLWIDDFIKINSAMFEC